MSESENGREREREEEREIKRIWGERIRKKLKNNRLSDEYFFTKSERSQKITFNYLTNYS